MIICFRIGERITPVEPEHRHKRFDRREGLASIFWSNAPSALVSKTSEPSHSSMSYNMSGLRGCTTSGTPGFVGSGNQPRLCCVRPGHGECEKTIRSGALEAHEQGGIHLLVYQRGFAAIYRGAIKAGRAVEGIAPDPEQPLRLRE